MRIAAVSLACFLLRSQVGAQSTVQLWENGAPGAQGTTETDIPTLTIFPANGSTRTTTGIVICPGGGYQHLSMVKEGSDVAKWLNERGISGFVLRYRLGPKYHYPVELWDAQRALRYVRAHAAEFRVSPDRIGMWGFSAGGHLASTAGTHFDKGDVSATDLITRQSARPDFLILAYPVISLEDPYAHVGSRTNLLGEKPDPALVQFLSNERQVSAETPPTFLFHTTEDQTVPVENSVFFYLALRKAGVPAEMHIYLKGHHGVGLAPGDDVLRSWPDRLYDWLRVQGLTQTSTTPANR